MTADSIPEELRPVQTKLCPNCGVLFARRPGQAPSHWKRKRVCKKTCHKIIPLRVRFWAKVDQSGGADACWPWTGHIIQTGYGLLSMRPVSVIPGYAHRISWEIHNGPIPEGLWVLHRCDNPPCINPAHLWLGTTHDNIADRTAKGRGRNAMSAGSPWLREMEWLRAEVERLRRLLSAAGIEYDAPEPPKRRVRYEVPR